MVGLPREILEAAEVDGAGTFRCFIHVALPVCRPILGAAVALSFADCWNLVEQPLTYLGRADAAHAPLGDVQPAHRKPHRRGVRRRGALHPVPALLVYLYFQKDILSGIQLTELK